MSPVQLTRPKARSFAPWLLLPWALATLFVSASLMAAHWATLPRPTGAERGFQVSLSELRSNAKPSEWLAVHVLATRCRCSRRLLEHLAKRGPERGFREMLLLVGDDLSFGEPARLAGFDVRVVTPQELEHRYHVQAVPLLLVADPGGVLRYSGGYTDRKQGPVIRDLEVLRSARLALRQTELPLLGCAVSRELRQLLDPLNVEYASSAD